MKHDDYVPEISEDDVQRIKSRLRKVGGPNVVWGASSVLEVWIVENRMKQEIIQSKRMALASWSLVAVTLALVVVTAGLIWATLAV